MRVSVLPRINHLEKEMYSTKGKAAGQWVYRFSNSIERHNREGEIAFLVSSFPI